MILGSFRKEQNKYGLCTKIESGLGWIERYFTGKEKYQKFFRKVNKFGYILILLKLSIGTGNNINIMKNNYNQ